MLCPKCQVEMTKGIAMGQTANKGRRGQEIYSRYPCGPGFLKTCLKCPECGYSKDAMFEEEP